MPSSPMLHNRPTTGAPNASRGRPADRHFRAWLTKLWSASIGSLHARGDSSIRRVSSLVDRNGTLSNHLKTQHSVRFAERLRRPGLGPGTRPGSAWDHLVVTQLSAPDQAPDQQDRTASFGAAPLGPLDGRYRRTVEPLAAHLSEAALNQRRLHVEVEWLIHLSETGAVPGLRRLTAEETGYLRQVADGFDAAAVAELAETERVTLHDVKAVEYYLKKRLTGTSLADLDEIVHL